MNNYCLRGTSMEIITSILEGAVRYLSTIRVKDVLDIALMAYAMYWLLKLVGGSRVASLGKGVMVFLGALWISDALKLKGIYRTSLHCRNVVFTRNFPPVDSGFHLTF